MKTFVSPKNIRKVRLVLNIFFFLMVFMPFIVMTMKSFYPEDVDGFFAPLDYLFSFNELSIPVVIYILIAIGYFFIPKIKNKIVVFCLEIVSISLMATPCFIFLNFKYYFTAIYSCLTLVLFILALAVSIIEFVYSRKKIDEEMEERDKFSYFKTVAICLLTFTLFIPCMNLGIVEGTDYSFLRYNLISLFANENTNLIIISAIILLTFILTIVIYFLKFNKVIKEGIMLTLNFIILLLFALLLASRLQVLNSESLGFFAFVFVFVLYNLILSIYGFSKCFNCETCNNSEISKQIKLLRTKNNLTQEQFANKIFVSRSMVAKYENGYLIPDENTLNLISKEFLISKEELGVEDKSNINKSFINKFKPFILISSLIGSILAIVLMSIPMVQDFIFVDGATIDKIYIYKSFVSLFLSKGNYLFLSTLLTSIILFLTVIITYAIKRVGNRYQILYYIVSLNFLNIIFFITCIIVGVTYL